MSSEKRQQRVRGLLLDELRLLVGGELEDPKLSLVNVTDVVVSKDLHTVHVYVNHQDENVSKRDVISRLQKAIPYLRSQVGERLQLRTVPEILFEYDESPERAARLSELLREIAAEREAQAANPDGAAPAPDAAAAQTPDTSTSGA